MRPILHRADDGDEGHQRSDKRQEHRETVEADEVIHSEFRQPGTMIDELKGCLFRLEVKHRVTGDPQCGDRSHCASRTPDELRQLSTTESA